MNRLDLRLLNNQIKINSNSNTIKPIKANENQKKLSFEEVLKNVAKNNSEIKFSKHAIERMNKRNIKLSDNDIDKIKNAINKAGEKGVKEALILMNNTAFIASVKNRTIITTAASEQLKDNVFTNIDGAVIL
jgi:flagellar operon protein